jgi:hypothetical protein
MGSGLEPIFVWVRAVTRLSRAWSFLFSALNVGTYEEGGRNLSERPDKSNHPEATMEGVAISLASANAHPREKRAQRNRK